VLYNGLHVEIWLRSVLITRIPEYKRHKMTCQQNCSTNVEHFYKFAEFIQQLRTFYVTTQRAISDGHVKYSLIT